MRPPNAPPAEGNAMAWGQHFIVDMAACDKAAITNANAIRNFSRDLVVAIGMKAHGEPLVEHFATHTPEAAGFILVQLIETSNICAHFADLTGDVYLDVFSCKAFEEEAVVEVCRRHLKPRSLRRRTIARDARETGEAQSDAAE